VLQGNVHADHRDLVSISISSRKYSEQSELAHSASKNGLTHTLARPDHDRDREKTRDKLGEAERRSRLKSRESPPAWARHGGEQNQTAERLPRFRSPESPSAHAKCGGKQNQ
jgi:hypothetical protein